MKQQLTEAWTIHNSKNLLLINALDSESLQKKLNTRSRTVARQLAHMNNVRCSWLEVIARSIYIKDLLLDKSADAGKEILDTAFEKSAQAIKQLIEMSWEREGKLPSFKKGLIPFVCYLISHESHHRGNILLTLKQSGIKLPETVIADLWEWDK